MATKKHGFTLIELLVVLAVVAALAAILFPVFASVRHRARMTACASNLHQISLALSQYAAENDGNYPINDRTGPLLSLNPVWTLLTPYTDTTDIFHCPEAWGPYDKAQGYEYRGASSVYSIFTGPGSIPPPRQPHPGSGTVVAYCTTHTIHLAPDVWNYEGGHLNGPLLIVREDGSTSQIEAALVEQWDCHNGQWTKLPARGLPQVGDLRHDRYPGEEWPPQD